MTFPLIAAGFVAGFLLWGLAEYLLHRFAMHELKGKGLMSREHLEHHVHASWSFSVMHLLSWAGMLLVGFLAWFPLGWVTVSLAFGLSTAIGWSVGYFFYEYQHAVSHLQAPRSAYGTWLRRHHFHHHFGHPMANHGVTSPVWDIVFGTREQPERVRVPRRLVLAWMVDADGELLPQFRHHYELVGAADRSDRLADLDRVRAFASIAPPD